MNELITNKIKKELQKQLNLSDKQFINNNSKFKIKLINNNYKVILYESSYFIFNIFYDNLVLTHHSNSLNPYIDANSLTYKNLVFLTLAQPYKLKLINLSSNNITQFEINFNNLKLQRIFELSTAGLLLEFDEGKIYELIRNPLNGLESVDLTSIGELAWCFKEESYFITVIKGVYKFFSFELVENGTLFDNDQTPIKYQKQERFDTTSNNCCGGPLNFKFLFELPISSKQTITNCKINNNMLYIQTSGKLNIINLNTKLLEDYRDCKQFTIVTSNSKLIGDGILLIITLNNDILLEFLDYSKITTKLKLDIPQSQTVDSIEVWNNYELMIKLSINSTKLYKFKCFEDLEQIGEFMNLLKSFNSDLFYSLLLELVESRGEDNCGEFESFEVFDIISVLLMSRFDLDSLSIDNYSSDMKLDNNNNNDFYFYNRADLSKLLPSKCKNCINSIESDKFLKLSKIHKQNYNIKELSKIDQNKLINLIDLFNKFQNLFMFPRAVKLGNYKTNNDGNLLDYIDSWLASDLLDYKGFICSKLEVTLDELDQDYGLVIAEVFKPYLDLLNNLKQSPNHISNVPLNSELIRILKLKYKSNIRTSLNSQLNQFTQNNFNSLIPASFNMLKDIEYSYTLQSINYFNNPQGVLSLHEKFDNWEFTAQNESNLITKFKKLYCSAIFCKIFIEFDKIDFELVCKVKFNSKLVELGIDRGWWRFYQGFNNCKDNSNSSDNWLIGGKLLKSGIKSQLNLDLTDYYRLLIKKQSSIEIGLILGLAIQNLSKKCSKLTKLFSLYLPPLSNNLLISEFNKFKNDVENLGSINYLSQSSSLIGIGLLYCGTNPNIQFLYPILDRLRLVNSAFIISESTKQCAIILSSGVCIGLTQLNSEKWDLIAIKLVEIWNEAIQSPDNNVNDIEFQLIGVLLALGLKYSFSGKVNNIELNNIFNVIDFQNHSPLIVFFKGLFHYSMQLNMGVKPDKLELPPKLQNIKGLNSKLVIFYWKLKSSIWFAIGLHNLCSYNPTLSNYLWSEVQKYKVLLNSKKFNINNGGGKYTMEYTYLLISLALVNLGKLNNNLVTELLTLKASIELNFIEYKLIDLTLGLIYFSNFQKTLENNNLTKSLIILTFFPLTHSIKCSELQVFPEVFRLLLISRRASRFFGVRNKLNGDLIKAQVKLELVDKFGSDSDSKGNVSELILDTPCQLPDLKFLKSIEFLVPKGVIVKAIEPFTNSGEVEGSDIIKIKFNNEYQQIKLNLWTYITIVSPPSLEPFNVNWKLKFQGTENLLDYLKLKSILEGEKPTKFQLQLLALRFRESDRNSEFYRFCLLLIAKLEDCFNSIGENGEKENAGLNEEFIKLMI